MDAEAQLFKKAVDAAGVAVAQVERRVKHLSIAGVAREIFDAYMQIKNGEYKSALDKDESETADSSTDGDKIVTKPKKADNSSGNSDSKNVGTDKKSDSAKASGGSSSKSSDNSKSENSGRQPENVQKSNNNSEGEGTL